MAGQDSKFDDPRRSLLLGMLASGLYVVGNPLNPFGQLQAGRLGSAPRLAPGRSIFAMSGSVTVNGRRAAMDTFIRATDKVETGEKSHIIFVVGKDAFILRSKGSLQLEPDPAPPATASNKVKDTSVGVMRLLTGKLLSVFGKRKHKITTAVATIGIRGTGIYIESDPDESYVCTCYGTVDIGAINDPASNETIVSTHHSAPRYISASGSDGKLIHAAPFKNHDDEELLLIETLVGRSTPFIVPGGLRNRGRQY
ncbi:MAG: hypothetical protein GKR93_04365 [Gammaproteobacteria bacterium]|nr:hypothetical protein [Gammaproteobacteria bacterium]